MAINPRWLRTNRVVYNKTAGIFALLLQTPGPGQWFILTQNGDVLNRTSKEIASIYANMFMSLRSLPREEDIDEGIVKMLERAEIADPTTKWRKNALAILEKEVSYRKSGAIAAAVNAIRSSAAEETRASTKFAVDPYDPDSYWYESDEDSSMYEDFITMRDAHHPVNLIIVGPSGSGKTEGIQRLGKRLGVPVHIVNCQAITTPEKWIGQMTASPEHGTEFVPSQHIQWVERTHEDCEGFDRCIILYDEITRLRADLNNMTYSLFDTQRGLEVPQMNRRIQMAEENMVVATANIGAAFTGTHTQDRAFRERFSFTIERDFPTPEAEIEILVSSTGVSKAAAEEMVNVANNTRTLWRSETLESPISTRTLKAWSLLVSGGRSIKKASEYTVIPLYSAEGGLSSDRTRVASMIEGKVR